MTDECRVIHLGAGVILAFLQIIEWKIQGNNPETLRLTLRL